MGTLRTDHLNDAIVNEPVCIVVQCSVDPTQDRSGVLAVALAYGDGANVRRLYDLDDLQREYVAAVLDHAADGLLTRGLDDEGLETWAQVVADHRLAPLPDGAPIRR